MFKRTKLQEESFVANASRMIVGGVNGLEAGGMPAVSAFPSDEDILASLQPNESDLARLKELLSKTDRTRDVLRILLRHTDEEHARLLELRSRLFIQTHFTRFPDEIFSLIFEIAGQEDLLTSFRISWTCRRFREIALGNPRLWSFIFGVGMEGFEALALRCSGKGTEICLDTQDLRLTPSNCPCWQEDDRRRLHLFKVLDFAAKHAAGIVDLLLDLKAIRPQDFADYSSLSFPSLRSLRLGGVSSDDRIDNQQILKDWDMHSLRRLELRITGRGVLPTLQPNVLSGLTSFDTDSVGHDIDTMVSFLSQCKSLKSVELTVTKRGFFAMEIPTSGTQGLIRLLCVESFSIKFSSVYTASSIDAMLNYFDLPCLRSFAVAVEWDCEVLMRQEGGDMALLDSIRSTLERAKNCVESLSISLENGEAYDSLGHLCDKLPAFQCLYITVPYGIFRRRPLVRLKISKFKFYGYWDILHYLESSKESEECVVFDERNTWEDSDFDDIFRTAEVYKWYGSVTPP